MRPSFSAIFIYNTNQHLELELEFPRKVIFPKIQVFSVKKKINVLNTTICNILKISIVVSNILNLQENNGTSKILLKGSYTDFFNKRRVEKKGMNENDYLRTVCE